MSIRNLDKIFTPSSVALIGASSRPGAVGTVTLGEPAAAAAFRGGFIWSIRGMPAWMGCQSIRTLQACLRRPISPSSPRRPIRCLP